MRRTHELKVQKIFDTYIRQVIKKILSGKLKPKFRDLLKTVELDQKLTHDQKLEEAEKIFWQLIEELRREELPE